MATLNEWWDPAVLGPAAMEEAAKWTAKIVAALLIFIIGRWIAARIANLVVVATERARVEATLTRFLRSLIYMGLLVLVAMAAIGSLGVPMTSFLALVGAAGLAIGLALRDSLSNFASGVMLVFFRPFKVGDYVEAAGVAGTIDSISIFSTEFKTLDNRVVIVPNGMIYAGTITNYSALPSRRIDLVIAVAFGDNLTRAKDVIHAVLAADQRVLKHPAPTVLLLDFVPGGVNFAVRPWVATDDYWTVRGDLLEQIKLAIDGNGLAALPVPQHVQLVNPA
jgi:small conductance mechanosensitive channel